MMNRSTTTYCNAGIVTIWFLVFFGSYTSGTEQVSTSIRRSYLKTKGSSSSSSDTHHNNHDRMVQETNYNYVTTDLGDKNLYATIGNPLKGIADYPTFSTNKRMYDIASTIDIALEAYYVGLDDIMKFDPDKVGVSNAFDWTALEQRLDNTASRNRHAIITMICHYPSWDKISVPQYVLNATKLVPTNDDSEGLNGYTLYFGDAVLLKAIKYFIYEFGRRYDGDPRIGYIQLGLLGFWGEWHTYPDNHVPEYAKESVVTWYADAFHITKLQARYPFRSAYTNGFGLLDNSFTYYTLDGAANGGVNHSYYFWPTVVKAQQTDFWKRGPMGGETRPEQQSSVFDPSYPAGTYKKQDFIQCVKTTHATYMMHHDMFIYDGYDGEELENAVQAHAEMGYNYMIKKVGVVFLTTNPNIARVDVTVEQVGVAPFYYPLSISLKCPGLTSDRTVSGVESIINAGDTKTFSFYNVPKTASCMDAISFHLNSIYAYDDRPIQFAQGFDGTVKISVPITPSTNPQPSPTTFSPPTPSAILPPSPSPNQSQIILSLINSDTSLTSNRVQLQNGMFVDLAKTGRSLTLEARVYSGAYVFQTKDLAVKFLYNGNSHEEQWSPYIITGNSGGITDYLSIPGSKWVRLMVRNKLTNTPLIDRTFTFTIMDSSRPPVPVRKTRLTSESYDTNIPATSPTTTFNTPATDFNDIAHGFNTPSTPSIIQLEERRRYNVFIYHILIPVASVTLIAFIMTMCNMVKNKRNRKCNQQSTGNDDESNSSKINKSEHWDTLEESCMTDTESASIDQSNQR